MLRFISFLLLIAAGYLWGYEKSEEERRGIVRLEGLLSLLEEIRRSAFLYRLSLPAIYAAFLQTKGGAEAFVREENGQYRVTVFEDDSLLEPFLRRDLHLFFDKIGTLSSEEGLLLCEEMIARIKEALLKKREGYPQKKKLYLTLGIALGLFLVILLI